MGTHPIFESDFDCLTAEMSDLSDAESETEYVVEALIKYRKTKKNGAEYLVRWEGIDPDTGKPWEPTWEPAEEIEKNGNQNILNALKQSQQKKKEPKKTATK